MMTPHVRRDPRRRRRDPALAAEPAGAPEALPAAARRRVPAPANRQRIAPLVGARTTSTVVTDRRYGHLVREQVPGRSPDRRAGRPEHGRRDRPGDRGHRSARRRGHARPPGRPLGSNGRTSSVAVLRRRPSSSAAGAFGIEDPLVTLGVRPTVPSTDYGYLLPDPMHGADDRRPARLSAARASRRSPQTGAGERAVQAAGRRLERRHVRSGAAGAIRAALEKYTPLMMLDRAGRGLRAGARRRLRADPAPISIDHAVMEGAAARPPGRDGLDGRRLERPRQLVGAPRGAGRWRRRRRDRSRRPVAARPIEVGPDDLVVRPRRWAAVASSARRSGYDRLATPSARTSPAPAHPRPRCEALLDRVAAAGGPSVTNIADAPAPTTIVFGTDGWRAKIADDYTFENVRRCADGVAHYVVDRGEQAKGVVIAYDRRFASEHFAAAAAEVLLAHDIPVAFAAHAVPTQMSSTTRSSSAAAAAGIVITASHNPWTDNGFKVKSPTGAAAGPDILGVIEAQIARNGGTAIERRPFADARGGRPGRAVRPVRGLRAVRPPDGRPRRAQGGRHRSPRRPDVRAPGAGWIPRLLGGRPDPGHRDPPGAQPVLRRRSTPSRSGPHIDEALGMIAGGRLRPRAAARRRCRSRRARPTRRAPSSTSSRSPAC